MFTYRYSETCKSHASIWPLADSCGGGTRGWCLVVHGVTSETCQFRSAIGTTIFPSARKFGAFGSAAQSNLASAHTARFGTGRLERLPLEHLLRRQRFRRYAVDKAAAGRRVDT